MTDTRNWKCFFGLHQYEIIKQLKNTTVFASGGSLEYFTYVSQCRHCGKIKSVEI